jgi:Rps23 Pro-64 3,4-dihydroxylase Tpa1-like proline 4-hydroxylase
MTDSSRAAARSPDSFTLNPTLDIGRHAAAFAARRRAHVPDLLASPAAEWLHAWLAQSAQWSLVLHDGQNVREATPEQRRHADEVWERQMAAYAYARAREGFEFLYEHRRVADEARERASDDSPLARFVDYLNSPPFLGFARRLTGFADIVRADAQATRYRPGDFLTQHDDFDKTGRKLRRAAYVFNLTPRWHADWGGQLQFIGQDGHVAEAWVPRFNALNVFAVPQPHAVSIVAPFAAGARYAVTGWLLAN